MFMWEFHTNHRIMLRIDGLKLIHSWEIYKDVPFIQYNPIGYSHLIHVAGWITINYTILENVINRWQ